ncbi:transglutaminase-like domain-containing protein [Pseudomarimonas arenosa]|uniref:Transglutaminase domain-containing protein n=1 Tax=Pseudomarimonas arenosa TaxID=2774145 RepID=A0AAW3ZRE0_9GAMM|nr:transglutaminase-like domain-containing protein [Pseudomarimonas arenosa]MBD8528034.1 transglutaminase domain-containing protein [Pseudomarimonas arenosa]
MLSGLVGSSRGRYIDLPSGPGAPRFTAEVSFSPGLSLHWEGDWIEQAAGRLQSGPRKHGFLAVSTVSSWAEVAKQWSHRQDRFMQSASEALKSIPAVQLDDPKAVLQHYWTWLRREFDYQPTQRVFEGSTAPMPLEHVLATRRGDCDDLSLLLAAVLQRHGIASETVLLDTRLNDVPKSRLPTHQVNHVILYLPELNKYIDPTLAARSPLPTAGRSDYPFAVHTRSAAIRAIRRGAATDGVVRPAGH